MHKRDAIELKVYNFLEVIQLSPTLPIVTIRSCNLDGEELVLFFSKLTHISSQNLDRIFAIWKVRERISRSPTYVVTLTTVEHLINVKHQWNLQSWTIWCCCNDGEWPIKDLIFSNALNAQHVNGMTPNDLAINSGKLVKNTWACIMLTAYVLLLDTVE